MSAVIADPVSAVATGVGKLADFVGRFFTDKTQVEKDKASLELAQLVAESNEAAAQIAVDEAEAKSPDRINHWRGALGWACVGAITWHYILRRILLFLLPFVVTKMPELPDVSAAELSTLFDLVLVMLGSHAIPHIASTVSSFAPGGGK